MKSFLLYLDEEGVGDFIQNIDDYVENPQKLHHDFPDFFNDAEVKKVGARKTIAAIRKRISHLIDEGKGVHSPNSDMVEKIFTH